MYLVDPALARTRSRRPERHRQRGTPLRRPVAHPLQHRRLAVRDRAARRRRAARRGRRARPRPLRRREPGRRSPPAAPAPASPANRSSAGIIVDFSRHFRSILDETSDAVRVQPGVVHRDLARRLAASGRRFAPEPAHGECTLGGMAAGDASGPRAFRHGSMRDHVRALRVVLDDGSAWTVGRVPRWPPAEGEHGRLQDVVSSVVTLLEQNAEAIRDVPAAHAASTAAATCCTTCSTPSSSTWPGCWSAPRARSACSRRSSCARSRCRRGVPRRCSAFGSLDAALRAAQAALPTGPAACELMDRRLLRLARGDAAAAALVPAAEAVLLVEYEADGPAEARRLGPRPGRPLPPAERPLLALTACKPEEIDRFWQVREAALSGLAALRGTEQPVAVVEDAAVPTGAAAGVPAARSGSVAAARGVGDVPDPRRHGTGGHAAVPRPAAARGRGQAVGAGRRGLRRRAGDGRHDQQPQRRRPGAVAVGQPAVRPALPRLPRAEGRLRPAPPVQPRQDRRAGAGIADLAAAKSGE